MSSFILCHKDNGSHRSKQLIAWILGRPGRDTGFRRSCTKGGIDKKRRGVHSFYPLLNKEETQKSLKLKKHRRKWVNKQKPLKRKHKTPIRNYGRTWVNRQKPLKKKHKNSFCYGRPPASSAIGKAPYPDTF